MKLPPHLRIQEIALAPGQEWVDKTDSWRFLRLSVGGAYWLDPAQPRSLEPGELLVVAPGVYTVIRASQLSDALLHGFLFKSELLCGLLTLDERYFFESRRPDAIERVHFFPSTHPLARRLGVLVDAGVPQANLLQRAEVLCLAARFFARTIPTSPTPAKPSSTVQDRFQQIMSQMPDMEFIEHTTEQLAQLCDCSPRHFNRLFRGRFGKSLRVRQTELRLLKACRVLESSDEKISQVARDCGYTSLSLFNSLFKRHLGMGPSEFRQQGAQKPGNP